MSSAPKPRRDELFGDERKLRHVVEPCGGERNAVEVAPEAHVVDPGDPGDVLDVIDRARGGHARQLRRQGSILGQESQHHGLRVSRVLLGEVGDLGAERLLQDRPLSCQALVEELLTEIHAYRAAVVAHGPQHVVGHVSGVVAERSRRRVRGDHGFVRRLHRVEERGVGDVRTTSTIIPRSFMTLTTRKPSGVRPRLLPTSPELPPRRFEFDHVSVM